MNILMAFAMNRESFLLCIPYNIWIFCCAASAG